MMIYLTVFYILSIKRVIAWFRTIRHADTPTSGVMMIPTVIVRTDSSWEGSESGPNRAHHIICATPYMRAA